MTKKRPPADPRVGVALLARQITHELFTGGTGSHADRLVLTLDTQPKRDLGGWGETAVVRVIEAALLRGRYVPVTGGPPRA